MKQLQLAITAALVLGSVRAAADEEQGAAPAATRPAAPPVDAAEPRGPAPDPSRGDRYDGRRGGAGSESAALWPARVLLFPVRLLFIGLEPPAHFATEFEQRHHIFQHIHDWTTSRDGLIGIRPELHWQLSFKPSFGARFFDDRAFGYETSLTTIVTGGPDNVHGEVLARPTPFSSPVQLMFGSMYDRRNDRLFAGIDNTVPFQYGTLGPSRFQQDLVDVDAQLGFRLAPPLTLSAGAAFGWRQFGNGEAYNGDPPIEDIYCVRRSDGSCVPNTIDPQLVPGFVQGTHFFRGNAALTLDVRDSAVHSTVGLLLVGAADYTHGVAGDQSSYFRIHGAAAMPINLWGHRHVLLLRLGTQLAAPLGGSIIPFSELPTLGGPNDLRGFRDQLFRGYSSLIATWEYRFPVWMWMDAAVFVDYGGVFGTWYSGIAATRMQPDLGFSVRLFSRDRFYFRAQLAYGWGEGWRFTLSTSNWP